jgi:hypothetical protein
MITKSNFSENTIQNTEATKNKTHHTTGSVTCFSLVTELMENQQSHLKTILAVEKSPTATSTAKETVM